ncbi:MULTISPECIES: undecaprenyl-phosphate glucose phosphotransferase [Methylobacterium]|jgi:Undecaprenyl-phosphate glucose phosphotransferase|uniref:Undecaprenyl-phosphate glucose phosphotransferase n=1 Tax=Methylobacterium fujisawaense TaxID=107400 RepID=A0ABR6D6V5_9HYPH|nr:MULTISPECIES: undecaprenyl-phosphate glucose phosphotransferase [Methylobacterium]KOX44650.1 UDP-phosphate glucose phosphotransferase [Streptomyces purpurogeneiscleroticus]MBA9061791.1 Undecaprenyl-phosphate glucose phosphotransferase [Methylobacterium fujisawaense]MBP30687.1 undecaprenyl-phosphate glucose phosphotransferase [Methylobacterium sp.]MDH3028212.1 undecaprenyl-phosphate glucose phosphotransferase [Methylobacterium fujisawaense]
MSAFDIRDLLDAAVPMEASSAPARDSVPLAEAAVPGPTAISPVVVAGLVRALECALIFGLGTLLHVLMLRGRVPFGLTYAGAIGMIAVTTVTLIQASGGYRIAAFRSFFRTAIRLIVAWSLTFLMVATGLVLAKVADHYSRLWLGTFFGAGLAMLLVGRFVLFRIIDAQTRAGRFDRRTAIVGGGQPAEALIAALETQSESGIRIVGVFDDRNADRSSDVVAGHPKLGNVDDLVAYARHARLDLIVFTIPITAEARILQMLAKLWVLPIDIRLSAHAAKLRLRPRSYSYLGSVPVLDVFDRPIADWDVVVKAVFDRCVGLMMLLALSPLMLVIALAVRLTSRGPVLFRQKRHGFNNELIEVYKFRSMYVDQCDAGAARMVTRGDPRVTPVGRFIRKTSLDELPQLFNVLKGDLSLVGPRPHALQAKAANTLYDQVVDGYFARHKVKPGITGWAQVNGWRGETDTSEKLQRRVEHDLYYIENWSVLLDLQILLTTPFALFKTENAY